MRAPGNRPAPVPPTSGRRHPGARRRRRARRPIPAILLAAALTGTLLATAPPSPAASAPAPTSSAASATAATSPATSATGAVADRPAPGGREPVRGGKDPAHTDVLFVGAHPDDESGALATFGQWKQRDGLTTGVATITRGEGGGNAVGEEEGAALGLLREDEERAAVQHAGIRNVYYLDKADSWYTLSAPLVNSLWNAPPTASPSAGADSTPSRRDTLSRLVRLIRATTPRTVVTMEPRPFDNHGAHQEAARLTVEAYRLAGDPKAFPSQLTREHYRPWQPRELLARNGRFDGPVGRSCARTPQRDPRSGLPVEGWWTGVRAPGGRTTWAQRERDAAREYVSQGFGALDPVIRTPRDELPCEWFTVLARGGDPVRPTRAVGSGAADGAARGAASEAVSGTVDGAGSGTAEPVRRADPVRRAERAGRGELLPLYAEFRDWARAQGMPWLARGAQPAYPERPVTTIPAVPRAPQVDGTASPGEYEGADALRLEHWQGERCASAADCGATVRTVRHDDDLYVLFDVTDDAPGAALARTDCKRHWRTDSVEIALDPRGTADDTASTLKLGVLPFTAAGADADPTASARTGLTGLSDGGACAARDADNHQGPVEQTAPGVQVASQVSSPYQGYTVEVRIPLGTLPSAVDPDRFTVNYLLYDSNTQDRTGQTRLGWATFGSAQADPYTWGRARLPGYTPPADRPTEPRDPVIPNEAARSADSPASVRQSLRTGVPLAVGPREVRGPTP